MINKIDTLTNIADSMKMFYPSRPPEEWVRPQNGRFISCKSGRARVKYGKGRKGGREESG